MTTQIVYLAIDSQSLDIKKTDVSCAVFPSYDAFLSSDTEPSFFIVEGASAETCQIVLTALRRSIDTFLLPIFMHGDHDEPIVLLSDGTVDSVHSAVTKASRLRTKAVELHHDREEYVNSAILRILAFLFVRTTTVITPYRNWKNPYLYAYPLIEVLGGADSDGLEILTNMKNRRLVSAVEMVDRVRHCPKCSFTHFNFIDVCPSCGGIDIQQKPFLHCFTCGNVAPQEKYLQGGAMACPQCNAQLRHIGTDYDRPLENYTCNSCDHFFQDPDIIAHCQNCAKKSSPDELVPMPVYTYQLTDHGQHAVRTGELEDVYTMLDELQNINPAHFTYTVDWLYRLCARHNEELFSLVAIRINNIVELYNAIGRYRLVELVDGYISRIRQAIRTTDLTTRTTNDTVWILLPKTNCPNCEIVLKRILDLKSFTLQDEGVALKFNSATFSAPDGMVQGETGEQLMARLEGEIA